jgi:hypothetical protein
VPKQVPTVSLNIQEYCHPSIRLNARGGDESDPRRGHPRVRRFEIINTEEEADPAGKLLANDRCLMIAVGACEQNAGATSGGTNNHPAVWPAIIRQRRNPSSNCWTFTKKSIAGSYSRTTRATSSRCDITSVNLIRSRAY